MDSNKAVDKQAIESLNNYLQFLKGQGVSLKDISDGWHTFEELYYHRMILFLSISSKNSPIFYKWEMNC